MRLTDFTTMEGVKEGKRSKMKIWVGSFMTEKVREMEEKTRGGVNQEDEEGGGGLCPGFSGGK